MLAEERFGQILDLLNKQRTATVQELCEALGTSESTIRRDLTELDRLGKLNKVHGGATLPDSRFQAEEPTMQAKETLAVPQKRAIAAAAAALIHAEDFVFIDAGSTTLELVRALEGEALQANYVTNGVAHARTLAQKGCRVFLPGGLLRPQTEAIVGAAAVSSRTAHRSLQGSVPQAHRAGTGGAGPQYRCPEQPSAHAAFPCGKDILPAFLRRLLRLRW